MGTVSVRKRGTRRRLLAIASALGGFGAASAASAKAWADDDASVSAYLEWNEPALSPCPSRDALVLAVEGRLKRRVFVAERSSDVRLVVTVRKMEATWGAELELRDRRGETLGTRRVRSRGADCGGLGDSLPVVVALLIDLPRRDVVAAAPEERATTTGSLAPPADPPAQPPARAPVAVLALPRATPGSIGARVAMEGEIASGVLPGLSTGASLQGGIVTPSGWAIELGAGATLPSTTRTQAGSASFTSVFGELIVCAPLVRGWVALSACPGMRLGLVLAEGSTFDRNEAHARLLPEVSAGARLELPVGATLFLRLDAGATAPLARERYVFQADTGEVVPLHQPAAVAPRVAIGAGVTFF